MASLSQDELLAYLMSQRTVRRPSCAARLGNVLAWVITFGLFLMVVASFGPDLLVSYGVVAPETMERVLRPAPTVRAVQQQPTIVEQQIAPVFVPQVEAQPVQVEPTATPTPAPTPTAQSGFWTEAELASFRATEEAYYDVSTLPTAPPAFVQTVREGCDDPAKRAASPLLESWCAPLDE